ncbi:putative glutamine--tRNA ligase [Fusarium oxysporum f. sp. albedinis]|nr:putative glutamine--tRNA ligase [Fusarium oxysporum f. sp. albedinis]
MAPAPAPSQLIVTLQQSLPNTCLIPLIFFGTSPPYFTSHVPFLVLFSLIFALFFNLVPPVARHCRRPGATRTRHREPLHP